MKKLFLLLTLFVFVACGGGNGEAGNGESETPVVENGERQADTQENTQDDAQEETVGEPVVHLEDDSETLLYSLAGDEHIQGLAHGTSGEGGDLFNATENLMNAGTPTYTIVANPSGSGNSIELSNRQQVYYALDIYFPPLDMSFGGRYVFRASGRANDGSTMQFGRTDAPWSPYTSAPVDGGEWFLEYELSQADLTEHFTQNQRGVRILPNNPSMDFIVDSIEVVRIGERGTAEFVLPEWDTSIPSLAEAFEDYFIVGNIWSNNSRMNILNTEEGFLHHFNTVTAENNHKPNTMLSNNPPSDISDPSTWEWNFDTADFIVDWAEENDLFLVGHTLVWHSQSPHWLTNSSSGLLTRQEAIDNMHNYIQTVAGRYAGRIDAWDVVNEAMLSSLGGSDWQANPDWREQMRRGGHGIGNNQTHWFDAFANGAGDGEHGSDYIYYAFRFARMYAPDAILYYNDYNEEQPGKREAIAQMVEQINERWTNDPLYDNRLLIERIGMQSHYHIRGWTTNINDVRAAIERFAATGAMISITELDVTVHGSGTPNNAPEPTGEALEALFEEQAAVYARLFGYYLEFSDYIERVSIWGLADNQSWRSAGHPLLFDENFAAKPAFYAILEVLENN